MAEIVLSHCLPQFLSFSFTSGLCKIMVDSTARSQPSARHFVIRSVIFAGVLYLALRSWQPWPLH